MDGCLATRYLYCSIQYFRIANNNGTTLLKNHTSCERLNNNFWSNASRIAHRNAYDWFFHVSSSPFNFIIALYSVSSWPKAPALVMTKVDFPAWIRPMGTPDSSSSNNCIWFIPM